MSQCMHVRTRINPDESYTCEDCGRVLPSMNILQFQGKYEFLSNFYKKPIVFKTILFPSSEHAYHSEKAVYEEDRLKFTDPTMTCGQSKRAGRLVVCKPGWAEKLRIPAMREVLRAKFSDPELRKMLLETGNRKLVEGNFHHDNFWGDCSSRCIRCRCKVRYNNLGILLMELREEIRKEELPCQK